MNCRLGSLAKASLEEKIELLEKYPWSSYQSYMYGTGVRPVEDREAYLVKREASEKEKESRAAETFRESL